MKICLSGSFSTGKTSLFGELASRLVSATLVHEHSWDVKQLFPLIAWDDQLTRDYMLMSQLFLEKKAEQSGRTIICDTGVIEALAHSKVFGLRMRRELVRRIRHKPYDHVFLSHYEGVPLVDNFVRETSADLRVQIHNAILHMSKELGYTPIVLKGTLAERVDRVFDHVGISRSNIR